MNENKSTSYIRLFHASPKSPPVDIYLNGKNLVRNLSFSSFTEYIKIPSQIYNLEVYVAGTKGNPIIKNKVDIPPDEIITLAVIGMGEDISLFPIVDEKEPIPKGSTKLRFIHLSPNAPKVDVVLPNNQVLFEDIGYKDISEYENIPSGLYTIIIKPASTNKIALFVPNINLKPQRFYTIYAIGLLKEKPSLRVVIPLDGNSYLK